MEVLSQGLPVSMAYSASFYFSCTAKQAGSAARCPQLPLIDPWLYEGDWPHLLTALLLLYGLSIEQVSSTGQRVLEFICELKHLLESY